MEGDTDSTQRLGKAMVEAGKPSAETDTAEQLSSDSVFTQLHRISKKAKQDPSLGFTSLAHLLNMELLGEAYRRLRKDASPGVDGLTAETYEQDLLGNLQDLHRRLREGRYRAQPVRRVYIEQEGKQRPLGIPTVASYCPSGCRHSD